MKTFSQYLETQVIAGRLDKVKQEFDSWLNYAEDNISNKSPNYKSTISTLSKLDFSTPSSLSEIINRMQFLIIAHHNAATKWKEEEKWENDGWIIIEKLKKYKHSPVHKGQADNLPYSNKFSLLDKTGNYINNSNYKTRDNRYELIRQSENPYDPNLMSRPIPKDILLDRSKKKKLFHLYKWIEPQLQSLGRQGQQLLNGIETSIYDYLTWQAALDYLEDQKGMQSQTEKIRQVLKDLISH